MKTTRKPRKKKQFFVIVYTGRLFGTYIGPCSNQEEANHRAFIFCEELKNKK